MDGNGAQPGDVYKLVFELTARATDVPYEDFITELVEGLAAHYQAVACRLHLGRGDRPLATADPNQTIAGLDSEALARFDTIDSMLAESVRNDAVLRTALDLDGGDDIVGFLRRQLQAEETFAFPLTSRGRAFGAVTLYLTDFYPFCEADVRGLQAIGNVLHASRHQPHEEPQEQKTLPITSEKLRAYQEHLDEIGKVLDELIYLTAAKNVLLLDSGGDYIAKRGTDSSFSAASFATVVAGSFAACRRMAGLYGAELNCVNHEGDQGNIFVMEVAGTAVLAVVQADRGAPKLLEKWASSAADRLAEKYHALMEARVL